MKHTFRIPGSVFDLCPNLNRARKDGNGRDDLLVFRENRGRGESVLVTARNVFMVEMVLDELAAVADSRRLGMENRNTARTARETYDRSLEQIRETRAVVANRPGTQTTHQIR